MLGLHHISGGCSWPKRDCRPLERSSLYQHIIVYFSVTDRRRRFIHSLAPLFSPLLSSNPGRTRPLKTKISSFHSYTVKEKRWVSMSAVAHTRSAARRSLMNSCWNQRVERQEDLWEGIWLIKGTENITAHLGHFTKLRTGRIIAILPVSCPTCGNFWHGGNRVVRVTVSQYGTGLPPRVPY